MNIIEQAREVSARIWNAGYTDESATIDALIAELEKVTREAHENKDKARRAIEDAAAVAASLYTGLNGKGYTEAQIRKLGEAT